MDTSGVRRLTQVFIVVLFFSLFSRNHIANAVPPNFETLAKQGGSIAQYKRGGQSTDLVGTENHKIAVMWFKKASVQGHAETQYHLGNTYQLGKGTGQDYQEALKWFKIASVQGHPGATAFISLMYFHGTGVSHDYTELFKWLEKAAEMEQDEEMI